MGAVKQLISFIIDPQAPSTNCDVIVTPPSNISLPITIEPIDGKYNISFVPMEVGRHNISILVDNEHVKGSPFACNVYDVTKVIYLKCHKISSTWTSYLTKNSYRYTYQVFLKHY